jgi:hypothetical protein
LIWFVIAAELSTTACECIDCNREGPITGHLRAVAQNTEGAPVSGVSIHLDNRVYITEPQLTGADGVAVLLVYLDSEPTDTGIVTAFPPAGYQNPPPQPVTLQSGDTVAVTFALQAE